MTNIQKTLYIPLYGKAYVSQKGILLKDTKAEEIWKKEAFPLKGKSKSKWLAYYMGMRSAVFDHWLTKQMNAIKDCVILHIGCGMDSRVLRVGTQNHKWYDVDFPEVIEERKRYYTETAEYRMLAGDARNTCWLSDIPENQSAIVVMEGICMYLTEEECRNLFKALCTHFGEIMLLADCYTVMAAKLSRYKNPIRDVGVTKVYGTDNPAFLQTDELVYTEEHSMTPQNLIDELSGRERHIFQKLYAGKFAGKLYRMFEYRKTGKTQ